MMNRVKSNGHMHIFIYSLAAQREQYIKDKMEQRDQYKRALSAQVMFFNMTFNLQW